MSEQAYQPVDKREALRRWTRHQTTCKHNSEGQLRKNRERHLLAAKKIREGLNPYEIRRETGICPETTRRVKKMMDRGEI